MTLLVTVIADCAGAFEGGRIAAANGPVRRLVEGLPDDTLVRILRFSDTAMWHVGPEPVLRRELEWMDLPSGGYLSSLAHAVNLAGQTLSRETRDVRSVALLVSGGALSDPEEVVSVVMKRYFAGDGVDRFAVPLMPGADDEVLMLFAGEKSRVLPYEALLHPTMLLEAFGEEVVVSKGVVTLSCTIGLDEGDAVTVSVSGADMPAAKAAMREALRLFDARDADVRERVDRYMRRVL